MTDIIEKNIFRHTGRGLPRLSMTIVVPKVVKDEVTKSSWFLQWLADNYRGDILNHKDYAYQWQIILDFVRSSGLYKDEALTSQMTGWADDHIADPWLIAIAKEKDLIIVSEETRDPSW